MIHPDILRRHGIPVNKVVQEERNFIVVFPHAYHSGFNHGFNIAEAANFALPRWVEYGKRYRACCCAQNISAVDGQRLSLHPFISKYQPDRYDSWKEGRDFGPHPEDPPEIRELYQNINLQNPNEEEEKIVQRLAVVLDHPLLETHQPQPIPDFKEVITLNPEVKDTDWGPSFVEEEFNTKRCDIKLSLFHPPTDQVEELIEAQKAREQEEDKENIKDKKSRKFGFFGFSEAELQARMSMTKCYSRKKHKLRACKKCPGCQTPDCQECVFCKDLTKYGGPNKLRQKCKERICNNPTPVTCDKCTWNIDAITKSGTSSAKKSPAKSKKLPKQKKSTGGGRPKKSAIVAAATTTDSDSSCYSPVVRTRKSARALSDTDIENSPAAATRLHKRNSYKMLNHQETQQNYQESAHYQLVYHGTHPIFVPPSTIDTSSDASATPTDDEKVLIGGQFSDITVVFKDGQMDVNSCLLAAISSNFHSSLQDESTMVLLPDLSYSSFLKFLKFLFDSGESTQLDDNIRETVAYLGCKLLQPVPDFYQYLSTTASYNNASSHSNLIAASNNEQSQSINQKSNGISRIQQIKEDNIQKGEHNHVAPLSPQPNSPSPERVKKKCKRKRKDVIIRDFAEMELDAETLSRLNQELTKGQHTYSHQFPNQLFCHSCSETGFSSVAAIIEHIKTVHCWTHSLDHCVFCDIPFMSTPAAIKHEKNKCKNTTYSCYICGCSQGKRQDLIQHLLESHMRGIQRKCPHCSLDFLVLSTLSSSTWSHPDNCESRKASQQKSKEKNEKSVCRQKCVKCGALHSDIWKHRRNCIAMNTDIKFVCHCCSQGFRRMGSLTKHFTINVKCKKNAKNELEYQGVLKSLENPVKGLTTCADCGLRYATKRGRQTHARNCSAFTRFKCNACNKGMNALDGFHIHFSKYPACRSAKENKEIVAELMARSAKPDFHVCHLCGAQYKTKETIDKHMLTHAETVNYFYCNQPECGKSFLTLKSLDLHLKNHTMPMVICSICGKQVKQGSLGLHMVLHTGKKVTCPVCGKLFQHRGVLNKHFTACHTEKRRRKRRAAPQEGNELSYLVPYMQTIQVNMGSEGEEPHSGHIDHQHQDQQQHNQQQQLLQQHQQHAVLNNSSILIVKNNELFNEIVKTEKGATTTEEEREVEEEMSLREQQHHNNYQLQQHHRSRQILVNSSGQIVVEEGSSQHQALVIPNHHQQQGMLTNTTAANDHHQQLTIQNVQGSMYVPHSSNPILSVPLPPNYNKNNTDGTISTIDMNPIIQTTRANSKQQ